MAKKETGRRLVVALGDQLSTRLASFEDFDKERDAVWMAEVSGEARHVWTSKQRIAIFLSAMRHFRDELREQGYRVLYREYDDTPQRRGLGSALKAFLADADFEKVVMTWPGEYRVLEELRGACEAAGIELELLEDNSFLCTREAFAEHADGRKQLRMEFFYREMRKRHDVLMTKQGKPAGGDWNFDASNRKSFGKDGPENLTKRERFEPDAVTRAVIELVNDRLSDHPGSLDTFAWPVTRKDALKALRHFVKDELSRFGTYQDAMWTKEPFLHHSLLSSSINLKLLDPKEVIEAAAKAYEDGDAPIESVEGFVRQILGWREYVRGVYWLLMPEYLERNELEAEEPLPPFYWNGETEMACLADAVKQTLEYGYAHHIQRLMVTGLYALLLGVKPQELHEWYLAVYVDAVEWVELPNTLGMSQYGDGGVMGSKPYVATGKYIKRMSNYCSGCRYDPEKRTGEEACPFTTLYWDFLTRHRKRLDGNPRMRMQLRNVDRISDKETKEIAQRAKEIRSAHRKEKG